MNTSNSNSVSLTAENLAKLKANPELVNKDGTFDHRVAKAKYYDPQVVANIICHRNVRLSPRAAFLAAGLSRTQYVNWENKANRSNCPRPLQYLFGDIMQPRTTDTLHNSVGHGGAKVRHYLYENAAIVASIIEHKKKGLPNRAAFQAAGIGMSTYYSWKCQLENPDCPVALKNLFLAMDKVDVIVMESVLEVMIREVVERGNWKAASKLLPLRWKEYFSTQTDIKDVTPHSQPTFNLDCLTQDEQRVFVELSKKARVTNPDTEDSRVKLLISLPDNGRS